MNYIKKIIYNGKLQNLVDLGIEQLEEDNFLSAIDFFSHALNMNDSFEEALFQRGKCFLHLNNFEKAKNDFCRLEKSTHIYNSEIYYLLVRIFLSQNNSAKATEYAEKYLELNSEDIQAQYFLARTKYLNKEYDESLNLVDILALNIEDDFNLLYLRSLILFAQENFISAINDIDKAISINHLNEYAFNLRALLHIQLFDYKEAINDFNYAINLCPTNSIYYFNLAKIQIKIGDLIASNESISKAIEIDSNNKSYYMLKGELELINENIVDALDSYMKAYQIDKDDLNLFQHISKLKINSINFTNANSDLDQIKKIRIENCDDYYYGAFLDYQLNNKDGSIDNLKILIKNNSENMDAILQLGILELSLQKYSEAFEFLSLIPKEDSNYKKAVLYKLQALINLDKVKDALIEFNNLSYSDQNDYLVLGAQINFLNENYEFAKEYLNKFIKNNTTNNNSKLLLNLITANQAEINQVEELNEFEFEENFKRDAQIFNGILNFEKDQYYSAKHRLSNIHDLSFDDQKSLEPLLLFVEKQIS